MRHTQCGTEWARGAQKKKGNVHTEAGVEVERMKNFYFDFNQSLQEIQNKNNDNIYNNYNKKDKDKHKHRKRFESER